MFNTTLRCRRSQQRAVKRVEQHVRSNLAVSIHNLVFRDATHHGVIVALPRAVCATAVTDVCDIVPEKRRRALVADDSLPSRRGNATVTRKRSGFMVSRSLAITPWQIAFAARHHLQIVLDGERARRNGTKDNIVAAASVSSGTTALHTRIHVLQYNNLATVNAPRRVSPCASPRARATGGESRTDKYKLKTRTQKQPASHRILT